MATRPQAGAQPFAFAEPTPQLAIDADGAIDPVAQLQAQLDSFQVQLFRLAVMRQIAVINSVHHKYSTNLSALTKQNRDEFFRFKERYLAFPNSIGNCLLGETKQEVTRYIDSQPWEVDNQESNI